MGDVGAAMSPSSSEISRRLIGTHCGILPTATFMRSVSSLPVSVAPAMANEDCPSDQITGYGAEKLEENGPDIVPEAFELVVLSKPRNDEDAVEEGKMNVATEELVDELVLVG